MSWAAVEGFRQWTANRRRLLQGLIGLAVEGVAGCVPGGGLAVWSTRIIGEFAKHGVDRLADTKAVVTDVKPAGQSIPAEELDQLNSWLATLSTAYAGLLDRLDALVTLPAEESNEQLSSLVREALSQHADLAREFDARAKEVRRQTLSLAHIEQRLDDLFHSQKGIALSLEEIKMLILQCAAPPGEWEMLRQARPEAVRLLIEADSHFLAGRREAGMDLLMRLFNERGVGQTTLCRRLGGAWLAEGKLKEAGRCLQQVAGPNGCPPAAVTRTLTSLISSTTRSARLKVWRSLPRGFVIEDRWRIDSEVGRGGMASVYRAEGIDDINRGQIVAIKIPAPGLLDDAASRQRFVQEIHVSQQLSRNHHRAIVETLGWVRFMEPYTGRPLHGLVMEFIDGQSLAHWLAHRQARGQPISVKEIETILRSVCAALEHAHGQSPPILHRDLKPHNVMVTREGRIKLMDFGIARVLEDRRQSLTTGVVGTWAYLPPEFLDPHYQLDVRSDVYLVANLLVELLTFHPQGDPERRDGCPQAWVELIGDSMNRVMSRRPASISEFLKRLLAQDPQQKRGIARSDTPPVERHGGGIIPDIFTHSVTLEDGTHIDCVDSSEEQLERQVRVTRIQMKGKWVDANEVWDLHGDIQIEGNQALGRMQYTLLQCASSAPESWKKRVGDSAIETVEGTLEAKCLTLHGVDVDDSTLLLTSETTISFTRDWRMFEGKTISRSGKRLIRGELQGSASVEM